jgi:hypothetical protein
MNITKELVDDIIRDLHMATASEFKTLCEPLCTIQNEQEDSVKDSTNYALCLITDHDGLFYGLRVLKPYICTDEDGVISYAWVNAEGQFLAQNKINPVCDWKNEPTVLGFKFI